MEKYNENLQIKEFQGDRFGNLRPVILMNFLQSMADSHAEKLGIGISFCNETNLAWVVINYKIKIESYPKAGQKIKLFTWPSKRDLLRATRDFLILDEDDNVLVRATNEYALIDMMTRKPVLLEKAVKDFQDLNERAIDYKFQKIPDFTGDIKIDFRVIYDDIDTNQHINNSIYLLWATESLGIDFRNNYLLKEIDINFKKEISPENEKVYLESKFDGETSFHKILTADGVIHSLIKCRWILK